MIKEENLVNVDIDTKSEPNTSLANIISTAIQLPGVKVNRNAFLCEQFKGCSQEVVDIILEKGPVEAGISRSEIRKIVRRIIKKKTLMSTGVSFAAGLPGGLAMAATIPADMLQFYGVALGMAQEIAYLYGEDDLWSDGILDSEKVTNQLILYCGVMLGASGAAQTVRVLSSSLAKQALKKLPQQALTKTFYYPVIKSIAKAFGAKMTKEVFAKGVSKAVPIIGGVVSGGLTFATMQPMGRKLADALDEAHFEYSQQDFEKDWNDIVEVCENEEEAVIVTEHGHEIMTEIQAESETKSGAADIDTMLEKIQQAKQMCDAGIISEEEFSAIKEKLISQM